MVDRLINPLKINSFFLFGTRGTGKSTFLSNYFPHDESVLWIEPPESGRGRSLERFAADMPKSEAFILSTAPMAKRIGKVKAFPWQQGLKEIGL